MQILFPSPRPASLVILGCTKLPLLMEKSTASVLFINPASTHGDAIVRLILNQP